MTGACVIVPAFEASATLGGVVDDLRAAVDLPVIVVDDGSHDSTHEVAQSRRVIALRHERNRGKGAALRTGFAEAARRGFDVAVTVDADGQHPAASALEVLRGSDDARALVLGVRDLVRDRAPARNRFGNAVSNFFLSRFSGRPLRDTQCGLRRYPVRETLALRAREDRYGFEAEVVLRAHAAGLSIIEVLVQAVYPPPGGGRTHFRPLADPTRIVLTVALTAAKLRFQPR